MENKSGYTSNTAPCDHGGEKKGKGEIRRVRKGTHEHNTRSRANHVTTFENIPKIFKMDMIDTAKTHIVSDYISHTDPKNILSRCNH